MTTPPGVDAAVSKTPMPRTAVSKAPAPKPTAAELARQRRSRRNARISSTLHGGALIPQGHRFSARQVPFVAVLVALLGVGLAGVISLNTLTDETGIRTYQIRTTSVLAQQRIEELESDIAARGATSAIGAAARKMGLVPAGDAAILVVPTDGAAPTVIGTPVAVVDPVAVAAAAAQQAAADQAAAAQAAAAQAAAAQAAAAQATADQAAAAQAAAAAAAAATAAATAAPAPADQAGAAPADSNPAPEPAPTTPADAAPTSPGASG